MERGPVERSIATESTALSQNDKAHFSDTHTTYGFTEFLERGVGEWDFHLLWPKASDSRVLERLVCLTVHSPSLTSLSLSSRTTSWSLLSLLALPSEKSKKKKKNKNKQKKKKTKSLTTRAHQHSNSKKYFDFEKFTSRMTVTKQTGNSFL